MIHGQATLVLPLVNHFMQEHPPSILSRQAGRDVNVYGVVLVFYYTRTNPPLSVVSYRQGGLTQLSLE